MASTQLTYHIYSPVAGPRGKMPWIKHGDNIVADSAAIIDYLLNTFGGDGREHLGDLRIALTPSERAKSTALQCITENIGIICLYWRFLGRQDSPHFYQLLMGKLPWGIRQTARWFVKKAMFSTLFQQGIARMHTEEKIAQAKADVDAMSELLGDSLYYAGDTISLIDLLPFVFLEELLHDPFKYYGVKDYALGKQNLVDYTNRIRTKYFTSTFSSEV